MIICGDILEARLAAVEAMVQSDVKTVTIFFNDERQKWCVKIEVFSTEEFEKMD